MARCNVHLGLASRSDRGAPPDSGWCLRVLCEAVFRCNRGEAVEEDQDQFLVGDGASGRPVGFLACVMRIGAELCEQFVEDIVFAVPDGVAWCLRFTVQWTLSLFGGSNPALAFHPSRFTASGAGSTSHRVNNSRRTGDNTGHGSNRRRPIRRNRVGDSAIVIGGGRRGG